MTALTGTHAHRWRLILNSVRTIVIFTLGIMVDWVSSVNVPGAATFTTTQSEHTASITSFGGLLIFLISVCWVSVFFRTKYPLIVVGAGLTLLLIGVSYLLLLIGVYHSILRWPKRTALISTSAGAAIAFYLLREIFTDWGSAFAWFFGKTVAPVDPIWIAVPLVVAALSIGVVAMMLVYRRVQSEASTVSIRSKELDEQAKALDIQRAHQSERERIARDLHDGLGHRLSSIALSAGAFESQATSEQLDPELANWARLVRQQAHAALEDVREVVGGLRADNGDTDIGGSVSLRQANQLLNDLRSAGHKIDAFVFLENIERIEQARDIAAFRILQEALTNAIKHAPGSAISVTLDAGPGRDIGA